MDHALRFTVPVEKFIHDERPFFTRMAHSYLDMIRPYSLEHFIERNECMRYDYPMHHESISSASQIQWSQIGNPSDFSRSPKMVRKPSYGHTDHPELGQAEIPALQGLIKRQEHAYFSCDIKSVHGLSASKSRLEDFRSMQDFALNRCGAFLGDMSADGFHKNLAHREIRIIHSPGADCFSRNTWDGKLYLQNHGGSHHFAAAQHIARELGINYTLNGALIEYQIDRVALLDLDTQFHMWVISGGSRFIMRKAIACGFGLNYFEAPPPHTSAGRIPHPRCRPPTRDLAAKTGP